MQSFVAFLIKFHLFCQFVITKVVVKVDQLKLRP